MTCDVSEHKIPSSDNWNKISAINRDKYINEYKCAYTFRSASLYGKKEPIVNLLTKVIFKSIAVKYIDSCPNTCKPLYYQGYVDEPFYYQGCVDEPFFTKVVWMTIEIQIKRFLYNRITTSVNFSENKR